jgi:hypothetical protein
MGEMRNDLKKVPAKIAVLVSQWVPPPSGRVIVAIKVGSGQSPVHRGSIKFIFPPFHSPLECVQAGEPTIAFTKGEVITP